jgi:type IV secretion system protein VirB3
VSAPCFKALTRPVALMGLPLSYVVILAMTSLGGFIATLSFLYLGASATLGYLALRALAAWDARYFDVVLVSLARTPPPRAWFKGRELVYRA